MNSPHVRCWFFLVCVFFLSLSFGQPTVAAELSTVEQTTLQLRLNQIDQDLQLIIKELKNQFGVRELYIGGGTARSVLQTALQNKPFVFRDFDLLVSVGNGSENQKVTFAQAFELGSSLEKNGLGVFSKENLRPRPRANPRLANPTEAANYNAGFGFFVDSKSAIEYDITLFHSKDDFELNGILDIDQLQIRVKEGQSLKELMANPRALKAATMAPRGALERVLNGGGQIVNWPAVQKDPLMISIRLVRALGKSNGLPLDGPTRNRLQELVQVRQLKIDTLQIARNLLKLMNDKDWAIELQELANLGIFDQTFSSFRNVLGKLEKNQIPQGVRNVLLRVAQEASTEDTLSFLKQLAEVEPEIVQDVLPEIIRIKKLRVGYYTGEFAPFHKGHEGVVTSALLSKQVDIVFVIATPFATNDPKTEQYDDVEWNERVQFVKAGLTDQPRAWSWPLRIPNLEDQKDRLGMVIDSLNKHVKTPVPLTHILGMDSLYRLVQRGLLISDPRPRIAVTRPGVPILPLKPEYRVTVIENSEQEPISATQTLQTLAMNSNADVNVHPAVRDLLLKTGRYADLIRDYSETYKSFSTVLYPPEKFAGKNFILDVRENRAGLYDPTFRAFNEGHRELVKDLLRLSPGKVYILLPLFDRNTPTDAYFSWKKALREFNDPRLQISDPKTLSVPGPVVRVMHSGMVNSWLKKKTFTSAFRNQGLIVFETADQPASDLIKNSSSIMVFSPAQEGQKVAARCQRIF
jgi:nicotinic acid mononucleotide adenylyltransferase